MKQQQRDLLQSIQSNYSNSQSNDYNIYKSQRNTPQELFLQKLINIYVLRKKQQSKIDFLRLHKISRQLKGGFTDLNIRTKFMSMCMTNKIQAEYHHFGILRLLTSWMDKVQILKKQKQVKLFVPIFGDLVRQNGVCQFQQVIVYLNYISLDIQSILKRPSVEQQKNEVSQISIGEIKKESSYLHLNGDDILQVLGHTLPKSLYNIILPQNLLYSKPLNSINPADQNQKDILYSHKSVQYFAKQKTYYQALLKQLFMALWEMDLKPNQLKVLMQNSFKYYYLFNSQKKYQASHIVIKSYERLTQAVRFALSDQFLLFFKIIIKLGKFKFIDYLKDKYEWTKNLLQKFESNTIIGSPKDTIYPYNALGVLDTIVIQRRSLAYRTFEIYYPYSIFYFYISIKNLDISIRLYYLGDFNSKLQKKKLLISKQRAQIEFRGNIMAIQKGLYMFQFDNSYSWMKAKTLLYENIILSPIQIKQKQNSCDKFLPVLFNKFNMNEIKSEKALFIEPITNRQSSQSNNSSISSVQMRNFQQLENNQQINQIYQDNRLVQDKMYVNLTYDSKEKIYCLKQSNKKKVYQFQTTEKLRFWNKIKILWKKISQNSFWNLQGQIQIKQISQIQVWLNKMLKEQQNQIEKQQVSSQIENEQVKSTNLQILNNQSQNKTNKQSKQNQKQNEKLINQQQINSKNNNIVFFNKEQNKRLNNLELSEVQREAKEKQPSAILQIKYTEKNENQQ